MSPAEARTRTTLDLLELIAAKEGRVARLDLWREAKAMKKISYPGFKETLTRLVTAGAIVVEVNPQELNNPTLILVTEFTRVLTLLGIVEVLEGKVFSPYPKDVVEESLFSGMEPNELGGQVSSSERKDLFESIVKNRALLFNIGERLALNRLSREDRLIVERVMREIQATVEQMPSYVESEPNDPVIDRSQEMHRQDHSIDVKTLLYYEHVPKLLADLQSNVSSEEPGARKSVLRVMLEFFGRLDQETLDVCKRFGTKLSEVTPFLLIRPIVPISTFEENYLEFYEEYQRDKLLRLKPRPDLNQDGNPA